MEASAEPERLEDLPDADLIHRVPSLFLIDIMLPGMSGVELAEQLRAEHFSDIPMIAMSASSFMVKTARATGLFAETVRKPFDVAGLLELVERYVS